MEILFELFAPFLSAGVGLTVGAVVLVLVVVVRRAIGHVSRRADAIDPTGAVWSVRVVFGLNLMASRRLAGMTPEARDRRRHRGGSDFGVDRGELWHPKKMLDAFDEAAGLLAPLLVVAAVFLIVVAVIEMLIALPIAFVFAIYCAFRGRWQVERVDPRGDRSIVNARSFAEAREIAGRVKLEIESSPAIRQPLS